MKYAELIQLYFERSNALQWYWTLYVVIAGGLLAFSSLRQRKDLLTVCLITLLFSFFAYKNLGAIHDTTTQRLATLQLIHHYPYTNTAEDFSVATSHTTLEPTLNPPEYEGVRNFHIASDLLVIATIWAMERRRSRPTATPLS